MARAVFLVAALLAVTVYTQNSTNEPVATGNRFVHYNLLSIISTDEQPLTANVSDSIWCQAALNDVPLPVVRATFIRYKDPQRREFEPDVNNTNHKATREIDPVVINNMGKYRCAIEINDNKTVYGNIMVYSSPFFHTNRSMNMVADEVNKQEVTADKLYATEGEPLEIHCPAVGYPKPAITWYKGDELIIADNASIWLRNGSTLLTIDKFTPSAAGTYRCTATNEYPGGLDEETMKHEASLVQEVVIETPYSWVYPLLIALSILLLLLITIVCAWAVCCHDDYYVEKKEKLLPNSSPLSSPTSSTDSII